MLNAWWIYIAMVPIFPRDSVRNFTRCGQKNLVMENLTVYHRVPQTRVFCRLTLYGE